ncbi:MAG: LysR family transcriptional regulator [Verrucomicrobiaceae bacterium]
MLLNFAQLIVEGLTLPRLQTFMRVVDSGSIVAAASGQRGCNQGQISKQITELERILKIKLFVRHQRPWELTQQGSDLAALVKAFLAGLNEITGQDQVLQVAGGESAFEEFLWPFFGSLQKSFERTRFEFHGTPSREAIARIGDGRADLALVRVEELNDEKHYSRVLGELPMLLVVRQDCLEEGEVPGFKILKRYAIPFLKHGGEMLKCLEDMAKQHKFQLKIAVEADSFHHAFELLRGGGVNAGILPRHLAEALPKQKFAVTAFKDNRLTRRIAIACDKSAANIREMLSHAVDTWADLVKSVKVGPRLP